MKNIASLYHVILFVIVKFVSAENGLRGLQSTTGNGITGFTLYKGDTNNIVIRQLDAIEDTINISDVGKYVTIVADTDLTTLTQVKFFWNDEHVRTEWQSPYTVSGDWQGYFYDFAQLKKEGTHVLTVQTFDENWRSLGMNSITLNIICGDNYEVDDDGLCVHKDVFTGFTLYKGETWTTVIEPLQVPEATIDLSAVGDKITVVAETDSTTLTQVKFSVNGNQISTDWHHPYALRGDWQGWYYDHEPFANIGTYAIDVQPFDELWRPMRTQSFSLNIIDSASDDCDEGFEKNSAGECVDIDECTTSTSICTEQYTECVNLEGSYECKCILGFAPSTLDGACVMKCATPAGNPCGPNTPCVDDDEIGHRCEPPIGGAFCPVGCPPTEECINGTCECKEGYVRTHPSLPCL